jgi:hypothetical protein
MLENLIMKSLYLFFSLLCAVASISCNKDRQSPEQTYSNTLPGVWELRAVHGGMVPYNPNNFKPGNGNLWAFSKTGFARLLNDSVYKNGTYAVSSGTGTDLNTGRKIDQFVFNNELAESFELKDDTLELYYGALAYDGNISLFVKISEDTTTYTSH